MTDDAVPRTCSACGVNKLRGDMMTTGVCVDCWIGDSAAQKQFKEDVQFYATGQAPHLEYADLSEFPDGVFAINLHIDGRHDDDSVYSIDPDLLAMETGENYGDNVTLKWVDDDPIEGNVQWCDGLRCETSVVQGYDCVTCKRCRDRKRRCRPSFEQIVDDFEQIKESNDEVREDDFEEFWQYSSDWQDAYLCFSCDKSMGMCAECWEFQKPRRVRLFTVYAAVKLKMAAMRARARVWRPGTDALLSRKRSFDALKV